MWLQSFRILSGRTIGLKIVRSVLRRTAYYGQYKCSGPGATELGRVAWSHELSDAEAAPFISLAFIDGQDWVSEP